MAAPARLDPASQEPPEPERPHSWGDARDVVVANACTAGLVAAELARDPGNGAALAMAGLLATSLQSLGGIIAEKLEAERRRAFDEKAQEAERREAFDEGFAAGQALKGRLSVVSSA